MQTANLIYELPGDCGQISYEINRTTGNIGAPDALGFEFPERWYIAGLQQPYETCEVAIAAAKAKMMQDRAWSVSVYKLPGVVQFAVRVRPHNDSPAHWLLMSDSGVCTGARLDPDWCEARRMGNLSPQPMQAMLKLSTLPASVCRRVTLTINP